MFFFYQVTDLCAICLDHHVRPIKYCHMSIVTAPSYHFKRKRVTRKLKKKKKKKKNQEGVGSPTNPNENIMPKLRIINRKWAKNGLILSILNKLKKQYTVFEVDQEANPFESNNNHQKKAVKKERHCCFPIKIKRCRRGGTNSGYKSLHNKKKP
jgi:hypothetical protein